MNNLSAIILCGGKGMRLRPLTEDMPKSLIEINGKPILYYIISHLLKNGVNKVFGQIKDINSFGDLIEV